MILFSHAAANFAVRHTARALSRAGILGEFWTLVPGVSTPTLRQVRATSPVAAATVAGLDTVLEPFAWGDPLDGTLAVPDVLADGFGGAKAAAELDREMSARLDPNRFAAVYAYEGAAAHTFEAAANRGLLRIYDLAFFDSGTGSPILDEEADAEPEWAATLDHRADELDLRARRAAELAAADLVLAGTSFGLDTLERTMPLPGTIVVVPPGAPLFPPLGATAHPFAPGPDKLRVLFAGPLDQRAGLSYLFRAGRELEGAILLTVMAKPPRHSCPALEKELKRVRWLPSFSAQELRRELAAHDVFVFPAIFENGSQLLLEAMAMGRPVIATAHSAAPDLISDGREGFIVPVRSAEKLVEKLEILRREPDRRNAMAELAHSRALAHHWESFERTLAASISTALADR